MLKGMGKTFAPAAIWLAAIVAAPVLAAPIPAAKFTVALDPGHGGTDLGAVHRDRKGKLELTEKEATLALAQEARRQLERLGYPVILTRSRDADIALNARTAIANRAKASIFVSIHMNSHAELSGAGKKPLPGAEGVETYILNSTSDSRSKRLADLENKGLDPTQGARKSEDSDVNLILKDMTLDSNLSESKRLACSIQKHMTGVTLQKARGVKQALFVVLLGADMPSCLLEAGFITSARDRKLVSSSHGVRAMGAAVVRAVEQFRRDQGTESARKELGSCLVSEH
jgi:N-acetylmuramoyl-L-alanine amidase